jgi:hypothetical protein
VTAVCALVYAATAQRRSLVIRLAAAIAVWAILAGIVQSVAWTPIGACLLNAVSIGANLLIWTARRRGMPI